MARLLAELDRGWCQPARGEQTNVWGREVTRCAEALEGMQIRMPIEAMDCLAALFFEIGRLGRDACGEREDSHG